MVPSWTETLIEAGINVVGRTRFCVHPAERVENIPIVGGTKEINWDLVNDLKADVLLLDKEENPISMLEEATMPVFATHVDSLQSLASELERLGDFFQNAKLIELSIECVDLLEKKPRAAFSQVPGLIEWVHRPRALSPKVTYIIWKKPWMTVTKGTYIGSVLSYLGAEIADFPEEESKYPVIEIEDFQESLLLFSSEPFPFHQKLKELRALGLSGCVVNGECYSWFGIRSLKFLKSLQLES